MDKINLNLYGLNFQKQVEKKEDENKAQNKENASVNADGKKVDSEAIYSAMNLTAAQNNAAVLGNALTIDPKKYLDDASIARIQGSMGEFENKTAEMANVIAAEFPGISEAQALALAARATLQTLE